MRTLLISITALASILALLPPDTALSRNTPVKNYLISGTANDEISGQLIKMSQDRGLDASWEIEWSYKEATHPNGCVARNVSVDLKMNAPMPNWPDSVLAPERLRTKWRHFTEALKMHHSGHKDIALLATGMIKKNIPEISGKDCARLRTNIETMASDIIKKARQQDAEYDVLTENGELQGVDIHLLK